MTWEFSQPQPGDAIRVQVKSIYHVGIFVSDDEVIQFGPNPALMAETPLQEISVMRVGIDEFLQGGFLQVARYTKKEQKKKRAPEAVISEARRRLGERGYDILRNNCEHFVNECLFGTHASTQVDAVRAFLRGRAMVTVYVARTDETAPCTPVFPPLREAYIHNTPHAGLRSQRNAVWRLLSYAMRDVLQIDMQKCAFEQLQTGQWVSPACCFSLSHTEGAVAAVVSKTPIGVDLERADRALEQIAGKLLDEAERSEFEKVPAGEKNRFLVRKWTQKEALFKQKGGAVFSPRLLVPDATVHTVLTKIGGESYFVSVAHAEAKLVRVVEVSSLP